MEQDAFNRRVLVKSSIFGVLSVCLPGVIYSKDIFSPESVRTDSALLHDRYPAIALDVALEVVSVSHFNLDRLKELVELRPELAKANWDWAFGDWESAIGAASHVGRIDIVE